MVIGDRRVAIVHPPKTGGQALQQAMIGDRALITGRGVRRHDTIETIYRKMPETRGVDWRRYILVRNPYARMVSLYHYHVQVPHARETPARLYVREFATCSQFLEWADFDRISAALNPDWRQQLLAPCSWYGKIDGVYDETLVPMHAETLADEALEQLLVTGMRRINESDHADWRTYYNGASARRVREYMAEDFERYGYDPADCMPWGEEEGDGDAVED